jgi:endonuclease/exonuclease/phosphatase (EEP) superfamily protein YafD
MMPDAEKKPDPAPLPAAPIREGQPPPKPAPRWRRVAARAALPLGPLGLALVSSAYAARPDALAALTAFPVWVWLIPGAVLWRLAWPASPAWARAAPGLLWLAFLFVFAEEPRDILRFRPAGAADFPAQRKDGKGFRVVTVNADSRIAAVREAADLDPDVILVQESPSRGELQAMLRDTLKWGFVQIGQDAAIVSRGRILGGWSQGDATHFERARLVRPLDFDVELFSVRLESPPVRFDLWWPPAWSEACRHRRRQREQLAGVAEALKEIPGQTPVLVAGDFNAPAGDAVFDLLKPRLRDAWLDGGHGLGNTVTNAWPFHRIDQIWVSGHFRVANVEVRKSAHSDHRMVIAELAVEPGR